MTTIDPSEALAAVNAIRENGIVATATTVAKHLGTREWTKVDDALLELVGSHQLERFEMVWGFAFEDEYRLDTKVPYYVPITG